MMFAEVSKCKDGDYRATVTVVNQEQYDGGPFDFGASYEDGSLDRVIRSLEQIREAIPEEYRATARCDIDSVSSWDSHCARIEISYQRPATPEEIVEYETEWRRREQAELSIARQTYERLKKQFEK